MEARIRSGYADTPLGQVHYREAGTGPPVILLHESPISGRIYDAALPAVGRRVRAIAPDTPGYGASDPPPEPLTIAGYAERLALFMDALGLERVALVGNHTGGSIAVQIAVDLPERVHSLVILGCPLYDKEEAQDKLQTYLEPFTLSPDGAHLEWLWSRYQRIWGADSPVELLHLAATEFLRIASRYDWAYQAAFKFEMAQLLPRIACPTLFLVTEGDLLRNRNEQAVALTPHAEGRIIDLPHGQYPIRDPEGFASELLAFLERTGYLDATGAP